MQISFVSNTGKISPARRVGETWLIYFPWTGEKMFLYIRKSIGTSFPHLVSTMVFHTMMFYLTHALGIVWISLEVLKPQAGNDMAFHRIFPNYGNLQIPRHWGLHGFSLTLKICDIESGSFLWLPMLVQ